MKPDLVCKIQVRTSKGKIRGGSGYPIRPNRIITAAHVIADAAPIEDSAEAGQAHDIRLSFGPLGKTFDLPVFIEWDGRKVGVDVAVLRCELPADLQPNHSLLTTPPQVPIKWFAQGYTDFGKQQRQDASGQADYQGGLSTFSDEQPTVALGCPDGPLTAKKWAGGSGSVAFDSATAKTALAVIIAYQGGRRLDQLKAIPLCYLLNSEATKEEFRKAINFPVYQEREAYRDQVIQDIKTELMSLPSDTSPKPLEKVAGAIRQLGGETADSIDLEKGDGALAQQTAACIVNHSVVSAVVGRLVGLMQNMGPHNARPIANIINRVLPLNYAPDVIQRLQGQLSQGKLGLVKDAVSTRTVAEIIMAGYDQSPAEYIEVVRSTTRDIPGKTALDYQADPEVGPTLLPRVRNVLQDLVALEDSLWGLDPGQPQRRDNDRELSNAALRQEIEVYVTRLEGAIEAAVDRYAGRHVYCVLKPPEDEADQKVRLEVLEEIAKHLPQLLFVELVADKNMQKQDLRQESRIRAHIIMCLVQTQ